MRLLRHSVLTAGMILLAAGITYPQSAYKLKSLARVGDRVGESQLQDIRLNEVAALNDNEEVVFIGGSTKGYGDIPENDLLILYSRGSLTKIARTGDPIGNTTFGRFWTRSYTGGRDETLIHLTNSSRIFLEGEPGLPGTGYELLVQYAEGRLVPLMVPGMVAGDTLWPWNSFVGRGSHSVNRSGNAAFSTGTRGTASVPMDPTASFLWEDATQRLIRLDPPGLLAFDGYWFMREVAWATFHPSLNNRNEIALFAHLGDSWRQSQAGILFRSVDGRLKPVVLRDQLLPDGLRVLVAFNPHLNDLGAVVFKAQRHGDAEKKIRSPSIYTWKEGIFTSVVSIDQHAPAARQFHSIEEAWWASSESNDLLLLTRGEEFGQLGLGGRQTAN